MSDTSKRYKPEQIVVLLREAEVELSKGSAVAVTELRDGDSFNRLWWHAAASALS